MTVTRTLFFAGAASGIAYAVFGPPLPIRGGGEMVAIAQHLARTGVFGHPYALTIDTGPTAVVPPLYPAALALLIRLGGYSAAFLILCAGLAAAMGLHASLLPRISELFYGDRRPGIYAALLSIALPVFSWMPYWDAIFTATGLMAFCLASTKLGPAACGLAAGLLALLNPASALVTVPWMVFRPGRGCARRVLVFAAAMALTVLPWSLRNYHQLGTFSLKTNLGMTLNASNNDCASSDMAGDLASGCYASHHPYGSLTEAELSQRLGEPAYDRYRTDTTMQWIRSHPAAFLRLTLRRIVEFWFPNPAYRLYGHAISLVTALSVPGLWLMYRRRTRALLFFGAVFLAYPCMYYVVVSDYRYRYPILWLSLLAAGFAIREVARWGRATIESCR